MKNPAVKRTERLSATGRLPASSTDYEPYYIGVFEVSQAEFQKVMGRNPSQFVQWRIGLDTSRFPVEQVSWDEAREFCRRMSSHCRRAGDRTCVSFADGSRMGIRVPGRYHDSFHFGTKLNGVEANCVGTSPFGTSEKGPNFSVPRESVRIRPIRSACTTCTAMFGNGAVISTTRTTTGRHLSTIRQDRRPHRVTSFEEADGRRRRTTAA